MYESAVIDIYYIVEAPLLMKSKRKRTVFDTVTEAVFHLVSVAENKRTLYNALITILIAIRSNCFIKQGVNVLTLDITLLFLCDIAAD